MIPAGILDIRHQHQGAFRVVHGRKIKLDLLRAHVKQKAETLVAFEQQLAPRTVCYRPNTGRLDSGLPPLVDVFVHGGFRDSRSTKINRVEARAIVDEIKRLTNDPAFAHRTIGVVSLLGAEQARRIFEILIAELGEEKILRHQIRCGDAMTFQGREADIVFISMVSDAETVQALTGRMYEQRFNVAVSRAKDRLYLFRSFRREDLRQNDFRAKLLDHFAAPLHRDPEKKGRDRCESDFERAVFDRLNTAGYRVTPQVAVGGRRIDLVVEGHQGRRLAIECDGDRYHTPDVWMEDLHRQRVLERAGWTFWRCWGSTAFLPIGVCI
jgi:very-short-patch-repair endonuclease